MPQGQDGRLAFPFVAVHAGDQRNGGAWPCLDPQHGDRDAAIRRFIGGGGDGEILPAYADHAAAPVSVFIGVNPGWRP
ncbi:hypothetical protein G6F59_018137 [Rhizopus arrhizus]|nr:hypothetical protein G6F59_018137 [Rhizopus arrhizus]